MCEICFLESEGWRIEGREEGRQIIVVYRAMLVDGIVVVAYWCKGQIAEITAFQL